LGRGLDARNIKKVIDALMQSPKSYSQLLLLGIPERSLSRILKEYLSPWGLALKGEKGKWHWFEFIRKFENKNDYELALNHSKRLVLSSPTDNLRYDAMEPFLAIDTLLYLEKLEGIKNIDDVSFLRHLKTGYSDTYQLIIDCRELLDEFNYFRKRDINYGGLPLSHLRHDFDTLDEQIQFLASYGEDFIMIPPYYSNYDKDKIERFFGLRARLLGEIYSIVNGVKHNIPLKGLCDYCPKIKIFDNEPS